MKFRFWTILVGISAFVILGCGDRDLRGTVYVVDQNQRVLRLALTPVEIYSVDDIRSFLKPLIKEESDSLKYWESFFSKIDTEFGIPDSELVSFCAFKWGFSSQASRVNELKARFGIKGFEKLESACWNDWRIDYFSKKGFFADQIFNANDLPKPLFSIKTNVDGNFSIKIPNKNLILIARTFREKNRDGSGEPYNWLIWISPKTKSPLDLNNENLFGDSDAELLRRLGWANGERAP